MEQGFEGAVDFTSQVHRRRRTVRCCTVHCRTSRRPDINRRRRISNSRDRRHRSFPKRRIRMVVRCILPRTITSRSFIDQPQVQELVAQAPPVSHLLVFLFK